MIAYDRRRATAALVPVLLLAGWSGAIRPALAADQSPAGGAVSEATGGPTNANNGAAAATNQATAAEIPTPGNAGLPPTAAPPVGVSVRLGDLGAITAAASGVGATPLQRSPGLTIVPTIGLQEEFTDNAFYNATNQADAITSVTPGLLINLQTPSATGTLSYAPTLQIYADHSSQNNVAQYLNGALQAALLPQTLFLSANAFVTEQNTFGGVPPGGISSFSTNNRTTTTGFSVGPTFQHKFGDAGTFVAGYSFYYTNQHGNAAFAPGSAQPFFLGSYAITNQESASFTSGPFLGRFNTTLAGSGAQSSGTGVLNGAYQYAVADTLRFAVRRRVYIFGTLGYENLFYQSVPPVTIRGAIWAAGLHLTPNERTDIIVGYGRFEGSNAPFARATISLSARTLLAISYSQTLGTASQSLETALAGSSVDAAGNPVAYGTGTPVLLTNQLLSVQSGLTRNTQFAASVITTWPRDTVSLSFLGERQKLIANAPGTVGFSQESLSGSVNWTHALSPLLTAATYLQMGSTTSQAVGSGTSPVFAAQLSLLYRLSPTLFGSLQYQNSDQWLGGGGTTVQNSVILGLQKTF